MNKKVARIVVILASFVLAAIVFGKLFWSPNSHMFTYSGDGYYIMYNMLHYAKNGQDMQLHSMNYPYGEVIFLTDAQGALSVVINWITTIWEGVTEYIVGINNGLLIYLIPLCSLLIYLSLKELKVSTTMAIFGAILITFLSPQINRMTTGHFGIGYVFLIPLVLYWLIRQLNDRPWKWGHILVPAVLLFLGFNNPYILLISASPLLVVFALQLIVNIKRPQQVLRSALPVLLVVLIPILLVVGGIKSMDQVDDRVMAPAGYSYNYSTFSSLFLPQTSELYEPFQKIVAYDKAPWEGRAYVGIIGLLVFSGIVLIWLKNLIKRRGKNWYQLTGSTTLNWLLWSTVPILVFSMNFFLYDDLIEIKWIPFIQQFRAPGRFSWVFYYIFSLAVVYCLDQAFFFLKRSKKQRLGYLLVGISFLVWGGDIYFYLKSLTEDLPYENHLSEEYLKPYRKIAQEFGLNSTNYQAIYPLPAIHLWTDKLVYESQFHTEIYCFPIAVVSNLPFLNAWLSRMSVGQTLESVQMVNHPLAQKKWAKRLPDERPILLVHGKKTELTPNEEYLISLSDTIYEDKKLFLFSYNPYNPVQDESWQNAQALFKQKQQEKYTPEIHYSFDDLESSKQFFGSGAKALAPKEKDILNFMIPDTFDYSEVYEWSLWVDIGRGHGGMPFIELFEQSEENEIIKKHMLWGARSQTVQDGWVRVSDEFEVDTTTRSIVLKASYNFATVVDEFQMRRVTDTTMVNAVESSYFLYNNIKVRKAED